MGDFTVIADTSQRLIEALRQGLVPVAVKSPEQIALCSPQEHGDASLGVFLYDIKECEELRPSGRMLLKEETLQKAPLCLSLFYMLTAYSTGDAKYRLAQEERILGRAMQTLYDRPYLSLAEGEGMSLRISLLSLGLDEKSRIWNFPNLDSRLSLFYKVSPVMLESGLSFGVNRVTEVDFQVWNRIDGG